MKTCIMCGNLWEPKNRYQAARNLTCGPVCAAARISQSLVGQTRVPPRIATCPQCQQEFTPGPHVTRGQKYCSRSCRAKANIAHLTPYAANGKGKRRPGKGLSGAANPAWKGGTTYFRKHGNYKPIKYVRCPADLLNMARKDGYVMEHRLIMARMAGRPLTRTEVVHHVDHNPQNNTPTNLELWPDNRTHKIAEAGRCVSGAACQLSPTGLVAP